MQALLIPCVIAIVTLTALISALFFDGRADVLASGIMLLALIYSGWRSFGP